MSSNNNNNNNKKKSTPADSKSTPPQQEQEFVALKPPSRKASAAKDKPAPPPQQQNKTGIALRLKEAVDAAPTRNRSADLVPLNHAYNTLRNQLRELTTGLKNHVAAMERVQQTQMEVISKLSSLAKDSPIAPYMDGGNNNNNNNDKKSYASVHKSLSAHHRTSLQKYRSSMVDYVAEWERVVTARVTAELSETERLHSNLNHYQTKVEKIRREVNAALDKGRASPARKTDKLKRNEDKLNEAWKEHERAASKLCDLLEEATERGWKDLYPLLVAMMQWDESDSAEQYRILTELDQVQRDMVEQASAAPAVAAPPSSLVADESIETSTEGEVVEDEEEEEVVVEDEEYVFEDAPSEEENAPASAEDLSGSKSGSASSSAGSGPKDMASPTGVTQYKEDEGKVRGEDAPVVPDLPEV